MAEWVLVVLAVIAVVVVVGMGFALIFFLIKKYLRFRAKVVKQEELLDEVAHLNNKVVNLMKEKRRNISNEGFTTWVKTNRI